MADRAVLLCDDNQEIRDLLAALIEDEPQLRVVGHAADGDEAVAEALRLQPDVITLDLAMPQRSGLAALIDLRRAAPAARIIVFSGFASPELIAEATRLGADDYVEKGHSVERLLGTLRASGTVAG